MHVPCNLASLELWNIGCPEIVGTHRNSWEEIKLVKVVFLIFQPLFTSCVRKLPTCSENIDGQVGGQVGRCVEGWLAEFKNKQKNEIYICTTRQTFSVNIFEE